MLHLLDSGTIALIDNEDISDLHDAGFESLDVVTHARHENHDRHVSEFHNIDFILPDSHGFNEDRMTCGGIQHSNHIGGCCGESPKMAACRHASNEYAGAV